MAQAHTRCVRLLAADDPLLVEPAGKLANEARRLHQDVETAAVARHDREDEIELLLRPRDRDIEQTPLLLFAGNDDLARRLGSRRRRRPLSLARCLALCLDMDLVLHTLR